jgi:quinol monooxygenase YgiN
MRRMLPMPWKTLAAPHGDKEYVALLSFLPLKHYRTVPKFFWLTLQTQQQLHNSKGLIGYSLHAQPLRRRFWTLSVWEDQQSLMAFVRQAPHAQIMQKLTPLMDKTQFVQWKVRALDIPPKWREAKTRMR